MRSVINRKIKNIKKEEGFTLLEVIVAVSILAFGLLAVASMQVTAIRGNYFASGITEATTWAQDQLEYLMTLNYDTDADLADGDHSGVDGRTVGKYNIVWTVADDDPIPNTKTINVIVTWSDQGVQRSVTVQHIIAETQYNT